MINKKFGIIGNETITIRCLQHMLSYTGIEIPFLIYDYLRDTPQFILRDFCKKENIQSYAVRSLKEESCRRIIKEAKTDLILSISNYWIIDKELLKNPKNGVINFHNGPPSAYHGINIPSWVILNGEKEHGVMWHYATCDIDSGDVIATKMFPVSEDETASSLMVKCIRNGIQLFKDIFHEIVNNNMHKTAQSKDANYYSKKDLPENKGILDFKWNYSKLDRMTRALNFNPYKNVFCYAKMKNVRGEAIINKIRRLNNYLANFKPGLVIKINKSQFLISCEDCIVRIESSMDHIGNELSPLDLAEILKLKEGDIYSPYL